MTENDLSRLQTLQVRKGDTILVTLSDTVPQGRLGEVTQTLEEFSDDNGVRILVFRESILADFTKLPLTELIALQGALEVAIREISARDALEI
jgi:hypothetical protein